MLQTISWQQYLLFLLVVVTVYYFAIWIVYFKARIPFLSRMGTSKHVLTEKDQPSETMSNSQLIIKEIKQSFRGKQNKEELIYSLQSQLSKYNQWDEPGFRDTINEYIMKESKQQCSIHLSEEDLRALWL